MKMMNYVNFSRNIFCFLCGFIFFNSTVCAQTKNLDYFISEGLKNSPGLHEINNLERYFKLQNDLINAQNKKPQVSFSADYLLSPFFFDNGRAVSITPNPSAKAYGYDAAISNGGLYAAQVNVALPLFNTAILKRLFEQNQIQSDISSFGKKQIEHDLEKTITDQYIITYEFHQQMDYQQKIIDQLESRKPLIAALVKQGLMQQNDFLLLDIQLSASKNDLKQLEFAYRNGVAILKNLAVIRDTSIYNLATPVITMNVPPDEFNYVRKFRLDSLNLTAQEKVFDTRYRPQVSFLGSTGINGSDLNNLYRNVGLSAGIHLSVPISDGHQRRLFHEQNKILIENQQIFFDNASALLQNNLRDAKIRIEQSRQTIEMLKDPIERQELLINMIRDKVVKGQVSVLEFVNALQEYATLQKNKALAETNLLLSINQFNYYNW